jgi:ABC-type antimicrobial peptide transport system permease subunit
MALKGKITTQELGGVSVRKGLVITQFAISQMLIIGMFVVASQLNYFNSKDLGFKKDAIVTIGLPFVNEQDITKMNTFKSLSAGLVGVEKFSYSMSGAPQTGWVNSTSIKFDNRPKEEDFGVNVKSIDAEYLPLYDIKLVAGRNIFPSDTSREFLINEMLVKRLGFKSPEEIINKTISSRGRNLPIVGVVKDFHMSGLNQAIAPLFMTSQMVNCYNANIKLSTGNIKSTLKSLENAYNQVYPDNYFEANFVDDQIALQYETEQTMGKLVNFFALVAIFIGCLGLYGLVSFMVAQKIKEIGVRKVLGATEAQILSLFGKEFGKLILIAFVIAAPLSWYVMNNWLQNYEYKTTIGFGIFIWAIGTSVLIAMGTVGYQTLKAAWANPAKSLKTE